jgi:hypothetical protein
MAELNFGLLNPPGSQSIGNAFVSGMDQAAAARARENQNALSQYTLSKARREDEQQNQLYRDIQDPNFKLDVRTALRYGPQGMAAFRAQQDAAAAALGTRVKQSTLDANAAKLPGEQADAFQKVLKPYSAAAYGSQTVDEGVASVKAMYANPTLAAVLTKIKPLEQAIADTTAAFGDPKTMTQWQAHWGGITPEKLFDAANARRPNPAKDLLILGPDGTLVPNTALIGVQTELRKAGASNLTVNNEKAYGGAVAAAAAKQDFAQIDRAQSLPQEFAKIDETLGILKNTAINTGLGANLFTILDKARVQVTADKKAGTRAVNTEYLDSLLGSAVFPQIQALGIGARGLDTPAERDFLRKVLTGSVSLSKDTLIKMTELRRKGLENEAALFNKRVEKGEFKYFEEAARRSVEAVTVPPLPTNATKGVARPTGVGSDWTLMTDAKGNSAWVSPDRKTFKEAK